MVKFNNSTANQESFESKIDHMYKNLEELNFQKMRVYLIKKQKQYQERKGYTEE